MAKFGYYERTSNRAKKTSGTSYEAKGKKPKLGTGKRFSALKNVLAKKGIKNPAALAAKIGRAKYGSSKMAQMAARRRFAGK